MSPWRTLQCFKAGAVEPRARKRQHVERQIEAEAALDVGGEKFEHASGAGAEIEQRTDRLVGERRADRVFDGGVGDMQLCGYGPIRRHGGGNNSARRRRARLAPRQAARGRGR